MIPLPARYEPCGLSQLYAMRYGTVPIVRATGGLRDTVVDAGDEANHLDAGTGFTFDGLTATAMLGGIDRALEMYRRPIAWRRIQRRAMVQDFGWEVPARRYLDLYHDLVHDPVAQPIPVEDAPV